MTPKLMDRLNRLEGYKIAQEGPRAPSPELVSVWIRAIAIALGGYPKPRKAVSGRGDSFSDGFARGLGYADRIGLESRSKADSEDWQRRIDRAHVALCERYDADPQAGGLKVLTAALDEWACAKAGNSEWPEHDDADRLARALFSYGAEAQGSEAQR